MRLGDICEFKSNCKDCDFWIIRKGSENVIGKPVKDFSSEYIGVKIIDENVVVPSFLFYYFQYLHMNGTFKHLAHGTLSLKNISISDIKNIPFGQ